MIHSTKDAELRNNLYFLKLRGNMVNNKSELKWVRRLQEEQEMAKRMEMEITQSEEYQELKQRIEQLRTEISMAIQERDNLLMHECRNIESLYLLKFGSLEYQVYSLECEYLRLKRKMELLISRRNRQEPIIMQEIDEILDGEFQKYQEEIDDKIRQINDALKWGQGSALSNEEARELKSLYRKLVKRLHPDINPDADDIQKELFLRAVEAYEKGNLEALRLISDLVGVEMPEERFAAPSIMKEDIARMEETLQNIRSSIGQIKQEYPYVLRQYLEDEALAQKHLEELNYLKEEYEHRIFLYKEEIAKYLKGAA